MKRTLVLALLGLALMAGTASANGWGSGAIQPGYIGANGYTTLSWGPPGGGGGGYGGGYGGGGGVRPYNLGPWYLYYPYEAHFQQPALPQYPYWGASTLPNGLPYLSPGYPGQGPVPGYWGR